MRTSTMARGAVVALAGALLSPGLATAASTKPDVQCQRAGIKTLQSAGLLDDVARDGLPISTAVSLGVTPRAGTDLSAVPNPLPLRVILADHRAGNKSLFIYPWCS